MNHEHRAATPAISWDWKEGKYWDLWMIVHFWSGVVIALIIPFIKAPQELLVGIAFLGLLAWELVEYFFDIHEVIENRILDIVFGLAGLLLVTKYVVPELKQASAVGWGLMIAFVVLVVLGFFGWRAYKKRTVVLSASLSTKGQ